MEEPTISGLFERGIRRVMIQGGPGENKKYRVEPEQLAEVIEAGMMTAEEVVTWFNEPEQAETDGDPLTPEQAKLRERVSDLVMWWARTSDNDIEMVAEKAVTYGSNSLEQLGRKMAQLNGRKDVSAEEAQELGCWVYLVGKVERWTDAVMRGERPKDDTLTDIVAYGMMTRRLREAGGWPDSQG